MTSAKSLNRQLIHSMAGVTGVGLVLMCGGIYAFYALIYFRFFVPDLGDLGGVPEPDTYWPTLPEWVAFLVLWAIGLTGAIVAATRFARKLIRPLEAVANAARKLAMGNLEARAVHPANGFAETRQLVGDFNQMAAQLGKAEAEMRAWHAAIAHELRTPLTILRGQLQGFVDGVFTPDTPTLRGLLVQVEGLSRIVDDLKILTLAQNGRLELRLEAVDLAHEVASVTGIMRPELERAGLTLQLDLGRVEVQADGARIRQALTALLDNARSHAAPGEVRVETRATRDYAVLRVSDNGPGLPDGSLDHVFEPFWRADAFQSRSGGSGLGLSVVRAITHAHGGIVVAMPGTPKGAVFEIRLQRAP
jgi:two-component system, OmpR family, sensor histidine kinase AdeS